ncbi:MAG: hypothetical protein LC114_20030 [Bryobacterales bacterium]|nr:hypothetical protein [Bryobacterales bacterium]
MMDAMLAASHRFRFFRKSTAYLSCLALFLVGASTVFATGPIPIEALPISRASGSAVSVQPLMQGEVPDVVVDLMTVPHGAAHKEPARADEAVVWLLVAGRGVMRTKDHVYAVEEETIARAPQGWDWQITAATGSTLQLVRVRRKLNEEDFGELAKFPEFQKEPLVRAFKDCTPYGESIKSAKTVSRTLLPENYVPRMAMGTVETTGPDAVAPHRHVLEQLFLGLRGGEITVTADEAKTTLGEFMILHIPLGSFHGASVEAGRRLHYVWMDFFGDKAGQEWLKTHKPLTTPNTP